MGEGGAGADNGQLGDRAGCLEADGVRDHHLAAVFYNQGHAHGATWLAHIESHDVAVEWHLEVSCTCWAGWGEAELAVGPEAEVCV